MGERRETVAATAPGPLAYTTAASHLRVATSSHEYTSSPNDTGTSIVFEIMRTTLLLLHDLKQLLPGTRPSITLDDEGAHLVIGICRGYGTAAASFVSYTLDDEDLDRSASSMAHEVTDLERARIERAERAERVQRSVKPTEPESPKSDPCKKP